MHRSLLGLAATLTLVPATPAFAADAAYRGASGDGSRIYYSTPDGLHARSGGESTLVTGPGSTFGAASEDGSAVFFSTDAPLTAQDTDATTDVYVRDGQGLRKLTPGNGPFAVELAGTAANGDRVWIETSEKLLPQDADSFYDVYEIATATGAVTLVTPGTAAKEASFAGAGGEKVYFVTAEALVGADGDQSSDVYVRTGDSVAVIAPGSEDLNMHAVGVSTDGLRVLLMTTEQLLPADLDVKNDLYEAGPDGLLLRTPSPNPGVEGSAVSLDAASPDLARIVFHTNEQLTAADTDTGSDVYTSHASTGVTLISPGGEEIVDVQDASSAANVVLLSTAGALLPSDTDTAVDLYRATSTGTLTHVNPTNGAADVPFGSHMSPNGNVIAFDTAEAFAAGDDDALTDTFVRNPTIKLASARLPGEGPTGDSQLVDITGAGTVVFETAERLVAADTDNDRDVYSYLGSEATLVSADPPPAAPPVTGDPSSTPNTTPTETSGGTQKEADVRPPLLAQLRAARKGSRLSVAFVISEVATIRVAVQRRVRGRWRKVKARTIAGHLGRHTVLLRVKGLRKGMRVVVTARDAAGNRSLPARLRIR